MDDDCVYDVNGVKLDVGCQVRVVGYNPTDNWFDSFRGVVDWVSSVDGDVRDGRIVGVPPRVGVLYRDGSLGTYQAYSTPPAMYVHGPWVVEEIEARILFKLPEEEK